MGRRVSKCLQRFNPSYTHRFDLLVHHEWAHAQDDPLEVSSLIIVAEHFTPCGLTHFCFSINAVQNLVELTLDFWVIIVLVEQASDDVSSFLCSSMFGKPANRQ
jgi:hypothetical protein